MLHKPPGIGKGLEVTTVGCGGSLDVPCGVNKYHLLCRSCNLYLINFIRNAQAQSGENPTFDP